MQRQHSSLKTRQPLLYAALAFAAGIVTGNYCWRPDLWWVIAAAVLSAAALYLQRRRARMATLLATAVWFCLGAMNVQLRQAPAIPDISLFTHQEEVTVTADVVHEGYLREAGFGGMRQQIDVETEELQTMSQTRRARFRIRLVIFSKQREPFALEGSPDLPIYRYGQRLHFVGRLREPHNYGNPGSFDYQNYLRDEGIAALASTKSDTVKVLPGFSGSRIEAVRAHLHRGIVEKIHLLWPAGDAGLMDAAVIGEDAFVFRSTRVDFQRSGTYHILVVSGMNVSILAFVAFWILRKFRAGEVMSSALTILLTLAYAWLTYVGPPVWRATLMMACYLAAGLLYRNRSMLNAWGAAALGIMIADPKSLLGASFQLTFLSVLILAAVAIPLLERTVQPYRRGVRHLEIKEIDPSVEPKVAQLRVELRMIGRRLGRFPGGRISLKLLAMVGGMALAASEVLLVSALMQIGLALPMAWYFHRATIVALPANALAVPLTELLMPAAVSALALAFFSPLLAKIPAGIALLALRGIAATVVGLGNLRIADVRVPMPSLWMSAAALMALAASMIGMRRRAIWAGLGIGAVLATSAGIILIPPRPQVRHGVVETTSIDVGQGDATLIISPEGRSMLIDAGGTPGGSQSNFEVGEDVVSPYLWSRGFSHLNVAVVTHGHWDHVGGMQAVLANFHPSELWVGANPPTESLSALLGYARAKSIAIRQFGAGDQVDYGGMHIRFLAPIKDEQQRRVNDDCLAMKIVFQNNSLLMEGDAEKATERSIAQQQPEAQLLKVGHHGSATSTSPELLAAVHPQFTVISVGRDNSYGHPRFEVLRRLGASGAAVYRTDMDGLVTFYLDGASISPAPR